MSQPDTLTINLLCMHDKDRDAYLAAASRSSPPEFAHITIHECSLSNLPSTLRFDAIVSPANSYGRLDGAFDDAISRSFSPRDDYLALTRVAQKVLYEEHRGWAIPGSCTVVPIPAAFAPPRSKNVWGATHLLLCPTMRVPQDVAWDKEVIYQCIWSLLCAIDKHNRSAGAGAGPGRIGSILMTPLATGVGRVSSHVWAAQLLLALRHFDQAIRNPAEFSALEVGRILSLDEEIQGTYESNLP